MAEPLLRIPPDWATITLEPSPQEGYLVSVSSGGTPSTRRPEYWGGSLPWITPREVTKMASGLYVTHTERMLTQAGLSSCAARMYPPNTVLLTKRAPVGAVAVNAVPMSANQGFLCFECGPFLDPLYLAFWLRINRTYLDRVANGSTYPELYPGDLFEFEMGVPPLSEQRQILEVVAALNLVVGLGRLSANTSLDPNGLADRNRQAGRLRDLRTEVLPWLFSGEVRVPELGEEQADVLG